MPPALCAARRAAGACTRTHLPPPAASAVSETSGGRCCLTRRCTAFRLSLSSSRGSSTGSDCAAPPAALADACSRHSACATSRPTTAASAASAAASGSTGSAGASSGASGPGAEAASAAGAAGTSASSLTVWPESETSCTMKSVKRSLVIARKPGPGVRNSVIPREASRSPATAIVASGRARQHSAQVGGPHHTDLISRRGSRKAAKSNANPRF